MSTKKNLFRTIFKSWGSVSDEEQQQRDYAIAKEKEERGDSMQVHKQSSFEEGELISEDVVSFCTEKLETLLQMSNLSGKVRVKKRNDRLLVLEVFDSGEDSSRIIGKSGATLEALQLLIKHFAIRSFQTAIPLIIDIKDYRQRRQAKLKTNALRAAEMVIHNGKKLELEIMTSTERRLVHMLFENNDLIETHSQGKGNERRIVLSKKRVPA